MKKSQFASVHGGLLARKGQAAPAIPSPFPHPSYSDAPPLPASDGHAEDSGCGRRDVKRWSDQPLIASKDPVRSKPLAVSGTDTSPRWPDRETNCVGGIDQRENLMDNDYSDLASSFEIAVHLTAEQKRRMRTISAQLDWSHQRILSNALDAYLDRMCEREMRGCACLNKRLGITAP